MSYRLEENTDTKYTDIYDTVNYADLQRLCLLMKVKNQYHQYQKAAYKILSE